MEEWTDTVTSDEEGRLVFTSVYSLRSSIYSLLLHIKAALNKQPPQSHCRQRALYAWHNV